MSLPFFEEEIMLFTFIDRLSFLSSLLSRILYVILTVAMLYEVGARYIFNASTIWAFDISYMATGAAFILGIAWTAQVDGHVKVDFLSQLLPQRISSIISGVAYLFVMCPIVSLLAWYGWKKTLYAFSTGEVEMVSTWAPKIWPFYSMIAIGLTLFALQLFVQGIRYFMGVDNNKDAI